MRGEGERKTCQKNGFDSFFSINPNPHRSPSLQDTSEHAPPCLPPASRGTAAEETHTKMKGNNKCIKKKETKNTIIFSFPHAILVINTVLNGCRCPVLRL